MGVYRARDVWRVPGLLSLSRLPLGAAFPFTLAHPGWALVVLAAAGGSDVLDGWYARRFGQVTATGTALDPITDKVFVLTVAASLVAAHLLRPLDVVLLSTRELAEVPLVVWIATSSRARSLRVAHPSANLPGKLATAFQFAAAGAALFRLLELRWLVGATAVVGLVAAATYWSRALHPARKS